LIRVILPLFKQFPKQRIVFLLQRQRSGGRLSQKPYKPNDSCEDEPTSPEVEEKI
jgi:hypothetical protein